MKLKILHTKIVKVPEECEASLSGKIFTFRGPMGELVFDCTRFNFTFDFLDGHIRIRVWHAGVDQASLVKTVESLIRNCVTGVCKGFSYTLKAAYNHFTINFEIEENGKVLVIRNFLGEKNPRRYRMLGGAKVRMSDQKDMIVVEGVSLPDVSQSAGAIQNACKARRLDSRVFLDGVYVIERGLIAQ
jgi:large subunit ribosomal protein L9e